MNKILYFFGYGLAARIKNLKKKYDGDKTVFNYTIVKLTISEYKGKFEYYASCYCSDVFMHGLNITNYITVYRKGGFKNLDEAENSLKKAVLFASRKLPSTTFYLEKPVDYNDPRLIKNKGDVLLKYIWGSFFYQEGKWNPIDPIELKPLCSFCGKAIKKGVLICPYCGEQNLTNHG